MVTSKATSIAAYVRSLTPAQRRSLEPLIALVRRLAPTATESMSYGMPGWFLDGPFVCLNAQKHHYSLYLTETDLVRKHQAGLGTRDVGKSCIRFRSLEQLDLGVVEAMLREAAARRTAAPPAGAAKPAAAKPAAAKRAAAKVASAPPSGRARPRAAAAKRRSPTLGARQPR